MSDLRQVMVALGRERGMPSWSVVATVPVKPDGEWQATNPGTPERQAYLDGWKAAQSLAERACGDDYRSQHGGDPIRIKWGDSADVEWERYASMPRNGDPEYYIVLRDLLEVDAPCCLLRWERGGW